MEGIKNRSECLCFYLQQNKQHVIIKIIAEKKLGIIKSKYVNRERTNNVTEKNLPHTQICRSSVIVS